MKNFTHYIYTGLLMTAAGNVSASTNVELNSVSVAMITFMAAAAIAFIVTYSMWKVNDLRKRKVIQRLIQREPVKRTPVPGFHKKKPAVVEQVK